MALLNVNRENSDAFYRYKMPALIAKVEGKGNGIKTVVVNMPEIGKALQRPPSYPCKFFGFELGAQTQLDKTGRHIVNGAHEGAKLQELLDAFIRKFVLCPECDNPETVLKCGKSAIKMQCQACGCSHQLDMKHKLATYMLRNPPDASTEGAGGRKEKAKKRKGKDKDAPSSPTEEAESNQFDDFKDLPPDNSKGRDQDDDWGEDTSEDAVKARMTDLSNGAAILTLNDDLEKSSKERLDLFYKFVAASKKAGGVPSIARDLVKIKAEAERLDMMEKAPGILAELIYSKNLLKEIKDYRPIMLHFTVDNPKGQKTLLGAFEIIVGKEHPELLPRAGHVLKAFYDEDILEEEVLLEWADKVSKKHVSKDVAKQIRDRAAPFIEWLRSAEEESSGEEDDEVEIVYSERQAGPAKVIKETPQKEEEDEEIDIDAI